MEKRIYLVLALQWPKEGLSAELYHQILFLYFFVGTEFFNTSLISNLSFVDYIGPVRRQGGELDILFGEKNGLSHFF